jgi:hypothetical protein
MSMELTPSRTLWWNGHRGAAFHDGVHVDLRKPPVLPGMDVEQLDYALDGRGARSVLERGRYWRDLSDAEAIEVVKLLDRMVAAVRAVVA